MKSIFATALFAVSLTAGAQGIYQFKDPGFDSATGSTTPYNEWYSFESASGKLSSMKSASPAPSVKSPGYDGTGKCMYIYSKDAFLAYANGNLTTGIINMGNFSPKDPSNYNYTDTTSGLLFAGRPDAVSFYAKFTYGKKKSGVKTVNVSHDARGQFILHDEFAYRDPETSDSTKHRVAKAAVYVKPEYTDWTYCEGPFVYDKENTGNTYLLASFTTNPEPGGTYDDKLWIDEVRFHYYHCLKNLAYGGTAISPTEGDTLKYDLSTQVYDESKLTFDKVGVGATVEKSYDSETGFLTLTVKGNDFEADNTSKTEYTLQFLPCKTYDEKIMVTIDGVSIDPIDASVTLGRVPSASTGMFSLKNFMLEGMPVGNITLSGVTMEDKDGYTALSTNQTIKIEPGDEEGISEDEWLGPILGDVPIDLTGKLVNGEIRVNIDIDMKESIGQVINVVMSNVHDLAINGIETLTQPEQPCIYKVRVCRQFKQGWNTYCMPVSIDLADLGSGVTAKEFASASENVLQFNKVTETLSAGVPYLVNFPAEATTEAYAYTTGYDLTPKSVTYGDWTFQGNYVKDFNMSGKYGVTDATYSDGTVYQHIVKGGQNSTLLATGAYFTTTNSNAASMRISFDDEVTGIGNIVTAPASEQQSAVYNLQGIKMSNGTTENLPAGIYVKGGKKIIIK